MVTDSPQRSRFSEAGLGIGLGGIFNSSFERGRFKFIEGQRGKQLVAVCDIGGSQSGQPYETFSFLLLDLDANPNWLQGQELFRAQVLPQRRRMAFKAMNDGMRRRALVPFLLLADQIDGVIITFIVDKRKRVRLALDGNLQVELAQFWKRSVAERLMWVLHLGAFLVGGFASEGQDVLFVIDQDEVAANVGQLTKLTELFSRAYSNQDCPMLGHIRCGTTQSDDGTLALEDLVSIPDLAAGALSELAAVMYQPSGALLSPVLRRLAAGVTWKTRVLLQWWLRDRLPLQRMTCLIDASTNSQKWRATHIRWQAFDNPMMIVR